MQPRRPRAAVTDEDACLIVRIPVRGPWWLRGIFVPAWLVGWGAAAFAEARTLLFGHSSHRGFLALWLAVWLPIGALALVGWLWMVAGYEEARADATALEIRQGIGRWFRTRRYAADEVRDLRVSPPTASDSAPGRVLRYWGIGAGAIAFDYGADTIRFGQGISEAEAKELVRRLDERLHPQPF